MHPAISQYQSDPNYAYLQKKVIHLKGKPPHVRERDMLIMESCGLLSIRLGAIKGEILIRPDNDGMNNVLDKIYAPLAASSFGDVPTKEEFLAMPTDDIHEWIKEAREVNSGFFEWLDAAEQVVSKLTNEQLKKKGKKRRKSAHG